MNSWYRVCFFKRLTDSTGHPVNACQGTFEVHALDQEGATEDGRLAFAKLRGIPHWSLHADYETVELLCIRKRIPKSARSKSAGEVAAGH
jgi:hypothetical protein